MNPRENERFTQYLLDAVQQAVSLGYPPNDFRRMLNEKGGFEAVKQIVAKREPSTGFYRLYDLGKTNLTCEAIIVETRWRTFFEADLLAIAEKRLQDFKYSFTPYAAIGRDEENEPSPPASIEGDFLPPVDDHRDRELRLVNTRPGQGKFREALFDRYGTHCLVSGCSVPESLEAAHITAYRGDRSDHIRNGLILRADLHALFDRYLFSIHPAGLHVVMSAAMRKDDSYKSLDGLDLLVSKPKEPSRDALKVHWSEFQSLHDVDNGA
jgi:hypothetical protein